MEKAHIDLIILSPSVEVNKLTFPAISTATTVGELREKISAAAVIHAAPARQRLIYRGHALVDAKKTLKEIFTQEIVCLQHPYTISFSKLISEQIESSDTLSLHLVLPPETAHQPSRSSTPTSIPGPGPRSRTPQHVHGSPDIGAIPQNAQQNNNPMNAAQGPAGQGNGLPMPQPSTPFHAQHNHAHHHGQAHAYGGLPPGQFPPQLQQAFAQLHAVNQQLAAQLAAIGNNPTLGGVQSNQAQAHLSQQPGSAQPSLQQIIAQQQQARAAAGQQGLYSWPPNTPQQPTPTTPPAPTSQVGTPNVQHNAHIPFSSPASGNTNTVVRENIGPNGERWQMVIQTGPMNINPNNIFQNNGAAFANSLHAGAGVPRHPSPGNQGSSRPPSAVRDHLGHNVGLVQLHSNLAAVEAAMAGGNPLPASVFDQARETLRSIPEVPEESQILAQRRIGNLAERADYLRRNQSDSFVSEAHARAATQRETQGAESSAVYVLSSPSGPQALLVSPSGLYTAPWQVPALGAIIPQSFGNYPPNLAMQNQPMAPNILVHRHNAQADAAQPAQMQQQAPQPGDHAQIVHVQQQQQANQARDLARILLPLGGHLWLFIRLFGFVYFFTAGAGWRRTILLGLVATLVFVAQTGIFRPIVQGLWDPIRRHAEGLVPLAGNERVAVGAAAGRDNVNAPGTQPTHRDPTPQEAAERLLRERERQDGNIFRQSIRRVERAIALFVASLVPGVGERHIAAREAAEAARQAEIREREEQARREEEARRQRHESAASDIAGAQGSDGAAGANIEASAAAGQEEAAQPPLVEV